MPQTSWTEWPVAFRQSPPGGPASEMNEAFFIAFRLRDGNHRSRLCPGDDLSASISGSTLGVWTPIGASSQLFIPRWAKVLLVRCSMVVGQHGPSSGATGSARAKLGTVYSAEMTVDADATINPPLQNTEATILIPPSMQDTEQPFTYEVRRNESFLTDYVRVFNDSRDAVDGHLHRHWLFMEAA